MFHTILPKTPQYFNEQSTNNQATENERRSRVERIFRIHSFQKQVLELRKLNIQPVIRKWSEKCEEIEEIGELP